MMAWSDAARRAAVQARKMRHVSIEKGTTGYNIKYRGSTIRSGIGVKKVATEISTSSVFRGEMARHLRNQRKFRRGR